MAAYRATTSRKDFTQRQMMACLTFLLGELVLHLTTCGHTAATFVETVAPEQVHWHKQQPPFVRQVLLTELEIFQPRFDRNCRA